MQFRRLSISLAVASAILGFSLSASQPALAKRHNVYVPNGIQLSVEPDQAPPNFTLLTNLNVSGYRLATRGQQIAIYTGQMLDPTTQQPFSVGTIMRIYTSCGQYVYGKVTGQGSNVFYVDTIATTLSC